MPESVTTTMVINFFLTNGHQSMKAGGAAMISSY